MMKSIRLFSRFSRSFSVRHATTRSALRPNARRLPPISCRPLSTTPDLSKGLSPDSSDPKPPNTEPATSPHATAEPAILSDSEYHEIADQYLNNLLLALEEKAESAEGIEVEYSAGVLTIAYSKGTYVINKQPPNRQIWLSSPISGPKRYDWVITGARQHEKEGSEYGGGDDGQGGRWVYLRDGTDMTALVKQEIGVEVTPGEESAVNAGREGSREGGAEFS